jgi:hypothetical protein
MMFKNPSNLKNIFVVFVGFIVYMTQAGTARLRVRRQNPIIKVGLGSFTRIIGPMNPFEIVYKEDDKSEGEKDEVRSGVSFTMCRASRSLSLFLLLLSNFSSDQ